MTMNFMQTENALLRLSVDFQREECTCLKGTHLKGALTNEALNY